MCVFVYLLVRFLLIILNVISTIMTGPVSTGTLSNCIFVVLNTNEQFEKDNYLDNYPGLQNTDTMSDENITKRIKEKLDNCRTWSTRYGPFKNNCEHLATYVRYGYKLSFQVSSQFNQSLFGMTLQKNVYVLSFN